MKNKIKSIEKISNWLIDNWFVESCDDSLGDYYDEVLNQRTVFWQDCEDNKIEPRHNFETDLDRTLQNFRSIKKMLLANRKINYVYA